MTGARLQLRTALGWCALVAAAGLALGAAPPAAPRLEDFIVPPGSKQPMKPFMLHADLWVGIDQRARLDTTAFSLENGARCCPVLNADSLWAVDYTWIYPHNVLPSRWYDARELLRVGDSLKVADDAAITFTFGTCRIGVRARTYEQARAEALRLWPHEMPERLKGRLRLKLERANAQLKRQSESKPKDGD